MIPRGTVEPYWAPVPSAAGYSLAFAQWGELCSSGDYDCDSVVNSVNGGQEQNLYMAPEGATIWSPAFSPDGSTIVFSNTCDSDDDQGIWSVSSSGGSVQNLLCISAWSFWSPHYSQDGRYIISAYSTTSGGPLGIWITNKNGFQGSPVGTLQSSQSVVPSLDVTRCMRLDILQPPN
jgi:Tol biopolymer transport system component